MAKAKDKNVKSKVQEEKEKRDKGTKILVFSMIAFVLIVGTVTAITTKISASNVLAPKVAVKADGYGIVYNAEKKPVIDMWEDFQCSVCGQFEATNRNYINSVVTGGKAKVVFHTMSFIGPESLLEANAGACAADQGKFLEMHTVLYANQGKENSGIWTNPSLIQAGAKAGLTNQAFIDCVNTGKFLKWVQHIATDASKHNVTSTPTVFVNGKELDRNTQYMDPNGFKAALAKAGVK